MTMPAFERASLFSGAACRLENGEDAGRPGKMFEKAVFGVGL
jgi:hypothetical protein